MTVLYGLTIDQEGCPSYLDAGGRPLVSIPRINLVMMLSGPGCIGTRE